MYDEYYMSSKNMKWTLEVLKQVLINEIKTKKIENYLQNYPLGKLPLTQIILPI